MKKLFFTKTVAGIMAAASMVSAIALMPAQANAAVVNNAAAISAQSKAVYGNRDMIVAFITKVYNSAGRKISSSELSYTATKIQYGSLTPTEFVMSVYDSYLYKSTYRSTNDIITSFYRGILGREPDSSGLKFWVATYHPSKHREILTGFVNSPEFIYNCTNTLRVKP